MVDTEGAWPRLLEAFNNPHTNLYFRSPGTGQTPGLTDRLVTTDPAHAATWFPDFDNAVSETPHLGGQRPRPEAVAVSGRRFGDNSTIKHTPPVPRDVDAPTHLLDLTYDPRKFISILGEKWDPGCVTTPKPTGYPLASEARTKILAGATTMAYNKCTDIVTSPTHSWTRTSSPGVGHWYVNTARERPATNRYTRVANDAARVTRGLPS
jgi:hypothetical protein